MVRNFISVATLLADMCCNFFKNRWQTVWQGWACVGVVSLKIIFGGFVASGCSALTWQHF
jgi:hypothetical protein